MVVVDELDRLKETGPTEHAKWRARYTLAFLDRVIFDPRLPARLFPEDFSGLNRGEIPRGEVTVEILLDPPGHVRLPDSDDEIIDRLVAVQPLAGRPVKLVTYDSGMRHRAMARDLPVEKLTTDPGPEPAPPQPKQRNNFAPPKVTSPSI